MKNHKIVLSAALVILVAIILLWINNYRLVVAINGLNSRDILYSGIDDNGSVYRIIETVPNRNKIALAYLSKNKLGIWSLSSSASYDKTTGQLASIGWMRQAGIKRFLASDNPIFETEWHRIYYGENAIKAISFLPGQIPGNIAVNIRQAGNQYSIHLISYESPDKLNNINMKEILKKAGCIS